MAGKSLDEIITLTGLSRPVVNKWRQRFRRYGIDGLQDAVRQYLLNRINYQMDALSKQNRIKSVFVSFAWYSI
ncbi:helix-turn-helix domain-containing protein [Mucilaginibacter sabulilitoris]|uniref:helix-turn-helix domain-containing protein n=1 Tax=Mucilaginibacter sabulilitoris TaxID=1173583 RepID=UPI003899391F